MRRLDGWGYVESNFDKTKISPTVNPVISAYLPSYPMIRRRAIADGHEIDNGGWKHRMISWDFDQHALEGFPEWEIEEIHGGPNGRKVPAFVELAHVRGVEANESSQLTREWDDIATVDFCKRDRTDDGMPTVNDGDTYWSLWWFATIAERDRFVVWKGERAKVRT